MNIHNVLRDGHQMFQQSLFGLGDADWERGGVAGKWSVKEIVAHAASLEKMLVELLESLANNRNAPLVARFAADPERFKVEEIRARRYLSPTDTFAEYDRAHRQAMILLQHLPAGLLREKALLPWYGEQSDLEDFLVDTFYGHKRDHAAHITLYRERLETVRDGRASLPLNERTQPAPAGQNEQTDWSFAARLWQPVPASYAPSM